MEKRFVFRGNAVGAAGHIHRPEDLIIWVQGAGSLPAIGGYSRSSVDRVKFGDVLSVENIRTQSTGDFSEAQKAYTTLTNSVVRGVNVNGRLTADSLEATLTSTHPVDGSEPSIVSTGTVIKNLRLDGHPINVTVDNDLFTKYSTRESLARAFSSDDAFYKRHGNRFQTSEKDKDKNKKTTGKRQIPEVSGYIVTSIVSDVQTKHPKAAVAGNVITLNGLGRIFLGELLITSASRRLTLLRLKLGSEIEGEIACAEIESNGSIIV
jgi:hypothetical protein